jgi:hypothetical protein
MAVTVNVKSALTMEFLEKLHSLRENHSVKLIKENYNPQMFGGALAFKIAVGDLLVEVSTQDPAAPYEIDVRRSDFRAWARASHLRSFFLKHDDPQWSVPDLQLRDWLMANFEEVYTLLCEPVFADKLAKFRARSRGRWMRSGSQRKWNTSTRAAVLRINPRPSPVHIPRSPSSSGLPPLSACGRLRRVSLRPHWLSRHLS